MINVLFKCDVTTHNAVKKAKKMIKENGFAIDRLFPYIIEDALIKFMENPDYFKYMNGAGLENRK